MALSRQTKEELYKALIDLGYSNEEIAKLKRPQMIQLLKSSPREENQKGEEAINILNNAVVKAEETNIEKKLDPGKEITPEDAEWTQYVLGMFLDDELDGKNPRLEGLRRISEILIGDIIEEGCDLIQCPNNENNMTACAKAWVKFLCADGLEKRYEALADASNDNCYSEFGKYLTAMADTRAKGRCYRNALKLRRVIAAEEVDKATILDKGDDDNQSIDTSQTTAIRILSKRFGVSIDKLIKYLNIGCTTNDNGFILTSLNKGTAKQILKALNDFGITKNIPNEIKE